MGERRLKVNGVSSAESLKLLILNSLKIVDTRKNCIAEFESRIKGYLERNRKLRIILVLNIESTRSAIRKRIENEIKPKLPYPKGWEPGQPNMMWSMESLPPRTEAEMKLEQEKIERTFDVEYERFLEELLKILSLSNGQIITEPPLQLEY